MINKIKSQIQKEYPDIDTYSIHFYQKVLERLQLVYRNCYGKSVGDDYDLVNYSTSLEADRLHELHTFIQKRRKDEKIT